MGNPYNEYINPYDKVDNHPYHRKTMGVELIDPRCWARNSSKSQVRLTSSLVTFVIATLCAVRLVAVVAVMAAGKAPTNLNLARQYTKVSQEQTKKRTMQRQVVLKLDLKNPRNE